MKLKQKNQNRVIHLDNLGEEGITKLSKSKSEYFFRHSLKNGKMQTYIGGNKAIFILETPKAMQTFSEILDKNEMQYSIHSAKDYNRLVKNSEFLFE